MTESQGSPIASSRPDFGYSRLWLHGHLFVSALSLLLMLWFLLSGCSRVWGMLAVMGILWGLAGYSLMRFVFLGAGIPKALSEARRVLRPGGQLLLSVILPNLWVNIAWPLVVWLRFPTRWQWKRFFQDAGLELVEERTSGTGAWFLLVRPEKSDLRP